MADLTLAKNELEEFKCDANESIRFKLVRTVKDFENDTHEFPPDMTHQIFGDNELIFGYKGLKIKIYYTACKLIPYLSVSSIETCDSAIHGIGADEIESALAKELPPHYLTNVDRFIEAVENDQNNFKPFGEQIDSYQLETKSGDLREFAVYYTKIEEPGFREYHSKLQSFIKYFIDAASYIDVDDELWDFFLMFEKYKVNGNTRYALAGYMTVYNFYAYPSKVRPRISQVLVLPPFQRMGLGGRFIQTFYNVAKNRKDVLDITVEDPSENFQRVRDFIDARNCSKLRSFQPTELVQGFSHDMTHDARNQLKLSKLQTRRVYEILRLKATDQNNKEKMRSYRLDVKKRLNIPFLKSRRTFKKLERTLNADELTQTLGIMKTEQKYQYLEKMFQEEVESYRHILDKLSSS